MPIFMGTTYATAALACDAMVDDYATAGGNNPVVTQNEKMAPSAASLAADIRAAYGEDDPTCRSWATLGEIEAAVTRWKS